MASRGFDPIVLLIGTKPSTHAWGLLESLALPWTACGLEGILESIEKKRPALLLAMEPVVAGLIGIPGRLMKERRGVLTWYHGVPGIATWHPDVVISNRKKRAEWTEDIATLTALFEIETGLCVAA